MDKKDSGESPVPIGELATQLERAGFFTHNALSSQAERINEIEGFLFALIDTLLARKLIDKAEFEGVVSAVRKEIHERNEHCHAGVALRRDKPEEPGAVAVNCAERLPVCRAVCCKLSFALSVAEVESGTARWDLGQPYFIRQGEEGYCCHCTADSHGCAIYEERPGVCRRYSCAHDPRIWKDFDKMELNQAWIDEALQVRKPRLEAFQMIPEEEVTYKSRQ